MNDSPSFYPARILYYTIVLLQNVCTCIYVHICVLQLYWCNSWFWSSHQAGQHGSLFPCLPRADLLAAQQTVPKVVWAISNTTNVSYDVLYGRAVICFTASIQADPTYVRAYVCRAEAYQRMNKVNFICLYWSSLLFENAVEESSAGLCESITHSTRWRKLSPVQGLSL